MFRANTQAFAPETRAKLTPQAVCFDFMGVRRGFVNTPALPGKALRPAEAAGRRAVPTGGVLRRETKPKAGFFDEEKNLAGTNGSDLLLPEKMGGFSLFKYILRRIGAMLLTLFLIMTLSFWIIRLMPMSIFENPNIPPDIQKLLMSEMHLDKPMLLQYYYFLEGIILEGEFGTSVKVRPRMDVFEILSSRIPPTVQLNFLSLLISLPLGVIFGTIAALRRNKATDNIISFLIVICISVPSFVFASLLQYCFTFRWPIFPTLYDSTATSFCGTLHSLTLPIIALALNPIATIARYLRGELIETLSSEYLLLARTKGLTRAQATVRHAFRNSLVPIANTIIPMITGIMGGSLVVEKMFAVPGMGGLLIDSILAGDHFLTVALLIFYSTISLCTILIVDISYGFIDPRIRIGGGK